MNDSSLVNIAAHLPAMAERQPQTLAIVEPHGFDAFGRMRYRHFTFAELDAETARLAAGLERLGIRRGMRTVLMVKPSLEFFSLTFALFKAGVVVVLIDPGMGTKNLGVCLKEAEPEAFIGITKAHLARVLFGWGRDTLRHFVTVGPRFGWSGYSLDQLRKWGHSSLSHSIGSKNEECPHLADTRADETAAILFTSGSTGVAKGVVYTHGIFAAQVEMLKQMYGIEPGEIDLPTFPLFGLFAPALGMTAIIPEMDATRPGSVEPTKIIDAIRYFGVTNLFGSPALIQRVGRYGLEHGVKLPTLRRVISAGAPVPAAAIERFTTMLADGVQLHTPYGATESLPVASIGSREILGETRQRTGEGDGVCVGRPVEGMRVKIIRISDEPIPTWSDALEVPRGEIGEIAVQGPVVTARYWNRPQSVALAKIVEPGGGAFWHRMGDVGYFDEHGRLWFCGRKAHRVVTPAGTLFTIPCEGVFNTHPAVYRTALVGVERGGVMQPVLCVEREKSGVVAGSPEVVARSPDRATRPDRRSPESREASEGAVETFGRVAVARSGDRATTLGSLTDEMLRRELLEIGAKYPHTKAIQTILFHPAFPVDIRHNAKIFREKLAIWAAKQWR